MRHQLPLLGCPQRGRQVGEVLKQVEALLRPVAQCPVAQLGALREQQRPHGATAAPAPPSSCCTAALFRHLPRDTAVSATIPMPPLSYCHDPSATPTPLPPPPSHCHHPDAVTIPVPPPSWCQHPSATTSVPPPSPCHHPSASIVPQPPSQFHHHPPATIPVLPSQFPHRSMATSPVPPSSSVTISGSPASDCHNHLTATTCECYHPSVTTTPMPPPSQCYHHPNATTMVPASWCYRSTATTQCHRSSTTTTPKPPPPQCHHAQPPALTASCASS